MSALRTLLIITSLFGFSVASGALPCYDIISSHAPVSACGSITRLAVWSDNLMGEVTVDVWTPAQYDGGSDKKYPVVYAHDGQNLFDATYSFAGVPWAMDMACAQLASDPDFVMPIIVGINNRGAEGLRPSDYFPEKALDYIDGDTFIFDTCCDIFNGNEHAAFVVYELKPLIDSLYRTDPSRTSTFAIGSSMGALAACYLLCEYPEVFGAAACMSTHWIGSLSLNPDYTIKDDKACANAILQYLRDNTPTDGMHRLYLDQGTEGWDAGYLGYETEARKIVGEKGYTDENGLLSTYDAEGAGHNEWFWQQRVDRPLRFLLSESAMASVENRPVAVAADRDCLIYNLTGRCYPAGCLGRLGSGIYVYQGKKMVKGR